MRDSSVTRLHLPDNEHCKRLKDPAHSGIFHLETLLPFSEIRKLDPGNANVRPPSENRKPYKEMMETVEDDPESFHIKNRGITYFCDEFKIDAKDRKLIITTPKYAVPEDEDNAKYGIADGGHTFAVIQATIDRGAEFNEKENWTEPYARVHFLSGDISSYVEDASVVEALNTSLQVKQYTLDEYQDVFVDLKKALEKAGFPVNEVAFRENDDKSWHVLEIIQRLGCFLRDRWTVTAPMQMYRSKVKALELFKANQDEFQKLYDVIVDVITLPEYMQAQFSRGSIVSGRSFGRLNVVKNVKKPYTRPGTTWGTDHKMDLGALLPMAAAFRELLQLKGRSSRYSWRVDPKEAFDKCGNQLHELLVGRSRKLRKASAIGGDAEYWASCVPIVMRAKDDILDEQLA